MATVVSGPATRPVYQALADGLAANGVRATFGLMGEDTAELITDLDRVGIAYHAARHENIALNMADGYAAMTGLGVCILSRGPGMTNAATAVATAARRRSPVLIVSGEMPAGTGSFAGAMKRVDHAGLGRALGMEYRTVADGDGVAAAFEEAVAIARSGRITQLAVPVDVLRGTTGRTPGAVDAPASGPDRSARVGDADLRETAAMLAEARRPFILAGRGAALSGARERLEALAERTGALVGTTMQAKDLFRGSPYDVGVVGGFSNPVARELLAEVDGALVFGARLSEFTTAHGRIFKGVPVFQFDVDPKPPAAGPDGIRQIVADADTAASQLLDALLAPTGDEHEQHAPATLERVTHCHRFEEEDRSGDDAIDPRALTARLDEILPHDRIILTDGGHCMGFPAMNMRVPGPRDYLLYDGIGAIGMGLGTAMGAALGRPGPAFVFFAGDGSLSMTMGDLETVVREQIPMLVVALNDGAYGAERHFLDLDGHPNHRSIFGDVDFAAVARGLGMEAATVRTHADLDALAPVLSAPRTAPMLLDCRILSDVRSRWMEEF